MKPALIFIAVCAIAASASAQVNRCKDASGKITFSDAPCATGQIGSQVQRAQTADEIYLERMQAAQARQDFQNQQAKTGTAATAATATLTPLLAGRPRAYDSPACVTTRKNGWGAQDGTMQIKAKQECARLAAEEREFERQYRGNCQSNFNRAADGTRCGQRSADARQGGN